MGTGGAGGGGGVGDLSAISTESPPSSESQGGFYFYDAKPLETRAEVEESIESRAWEKVKEPENVKERKKRRRPSLLESEEGLISTTPAYQRSLLR